jgi:Transposase IS116/IS110/IS902 family
MVAVLDELQLTGLVTSITGLSPVGAAAILAETGDPRRFATARSLVKHAGLAPREKPSGTFVGRTKLTGQAAPGCGWPPGARSGEPNAPIRSTELATATSPGASTTSSPRPRRRPRSPPRSCATSTRWSPPASGGTPTSPPTAAEPTQTCPSPPDPSRPADQAGGRGEPRAALRHPHGDLDAHHGQPRPSSLNPITRCWDQPHHRYAGTDDGRGTRPNA